MRRNKEKKIKQKLSVVRRVSYTFLAFAVFELSGVFALAGLKGLYVVTETKSNAFYPKTYVDVSIQEPNGSEYTIDSDNVAVYTDGNGTKKGKEVYVENPGKNNKKPVVVRARIVAEIYDETEGVHRESLASLDHTKLNDSSTYPNYKPDYMISINNSTTYDSTSQDTWYYSDGYYYYTSILDVASQTTNLFDQVKITDTGLAKIPEGGYVKFHVIIDCLDAAVVNDVGNYWSNVPKDVTDQWKKKTTS